MILALDIGNTNIVIGGIENRKFVLRERIATDLQKTEFEYTALLMTMLQMHGIGDGQVTGAIISSVVPQVTEHIRMAICRTAGCEVMIVGPDMKTGLAIQMDHPEQVGRDLIVGAVAGCAQFSLPLVVIDMGTATTLCVIDGQKNYIGGMIIPGLGISIQALSDRTAQLPHIDLTEPARLIGKNTVECMESGAMYGTASMLDGMLDRIEGEIGGKITAVATGGLAGSIIPLCRREITFDDDLLLRGLMILYEMNG